MQVSPFTVVVSLVQWSGYVRGNFVTQCCSRDLYCATIRRAMDNHITKESTNRSGVTEGEEEPFCRIKNDRVAIRRSVTENREKGKTYNNTGP